MQDNQIEDVDYKLHYAKDGIPFTKRPNYVNDNYIEKDGIKKEDILYIEVHHDSGTEEDVLEERWNLVKGFCILFAGNNHDADQILESEKFSKILLPFMTNANIDIPPNTYHAEFEGMPLLKDSDGLYIPGLYERVSPHSLFVLSNAATPAIILEAGCIVNPNEEKILSSDEGRQNIVNAINGSIEKYFNGNKI